MSFKRLFVSTGDASGDVHGARVIRQFQTHRPDVEIQAIGGTFIEETGVTLFHRQEKLGVLGIGFLGAIPYHLRLANDLIRHFTHAWRPDAVLLIDYGMFHLHLAKRLKALGIPVFYYIPPQVWASKRWRLKSIKKYVDHVFCIFPFEKPIYDAQAIPATFVGHPLAEAMAPPPDRLKFCNEFGLDPEKPIIGIFPGSRRMEIRSLLPPMLEALPRINQQHQQDFQFLLAKSPAITQEFLDATMAPYTNTLKGVSFQIIERRNEAILALSEAILAASGTITLEAALYGTPSVISYKLSAIAYWFFKHFKYVTHIGLPNILSERPEGFLPELMMADVTPENYAKAIGPYLKPSPERELADQELGKIKETLGQQPASLYVYKTLCELMEESFSS